MSFSPEPRVRDSFKLLYPCFPHLCRRRPVVPFLPGTGKSLLLRAIIAALKSKHAKKPAVVSVTASTGMAASNIGGTLFSPLPIKTVPRSPSWPDP